MEKQSNPGLIKELSSAVPLIYAFINFLAVLKLSLMYSCFFNINIIHYIDFSELLMVLFEDIRFVIIFFGLSLVQLTVFLGAEKIIGKKNFAINQYKKNPSMFTILYILIFLIFAAIYLKYPNYWLLFFVCLYLFQVLVIIFQQLKEKVQLIICTLSISIASIAGLVWHDINNITIEGRNIISFNYKNAIVKLKDEELVIGTTNKYIFVYNDSLENTTIYKRAEIDSVVVLFRNNFK